MRFTWLALALAALACGPAGQSGDDDDTSAMDGSGNDGSSSFDMTPLFDSGGDPNAGVYAHSQSDLYKVNPLTLAVTHVAPFDFGGDQMTDIAIDKDGNMTGISFGSVYAVDKDTGHCTYLSVLQTSMNGLSWVPAGKVDGTDSEVLIGAGEDGSVYRIDPMTGASTLLGSYGQGLGSSGDIVSVNGFGTVATVMKPGSVGDWLARIDPATGEAALIGEIQDPFKDPPSVPGFWGVGFWGGTLYGFTVGRQFYTIDPSTAQATLASTDVIDWWGAAVTTSAPIIP